MANEPSDLTIDIAGYRLNCRVGALIIRNDHLFACRLKESSNWFLPGGRVKAGESSEEAIERELREELGDSFTIGNVFAVTENFFTTDNANYHELCTYFEAEWQGDDPTPEENEEFAWHPVSVVSQLDLRPDFLKEALTEDRKQLRRYVIGK